jgi:TetR/AcrR family transcriptional regulator
MNQRSQKRDVREDILQEATRQFAENGVSGTSIQRIAAAVGIRRPSLLYHFPSKEALRLAVLESLLAHWRNTLPTVLAAATSGENRLDSALSAVAGFFLADQSRARLILREMLDNPDEMRALFLQHLRPWTALITDYIRTGQRSGQIPEDVNPESYILELVLMIVGTVALGDLASAMISDDNSSKDEQIDEVVRIARRSLFTQPPGDSNG